MLSGTSEIVANVIDNPLEASVELGSEVALSHSQNDATGERLMTRHLSGSNGPLSNLPPLRPGQKKAGSAFFRPITTSSSSSGEGETDEAKVGVTQGVRLFAPTPTIRLNDDELRLSPGSPRVVQANGTTTGVTGFPELVDPSDEVRAIFERGVALTKKDSLEDRLPKQTSLESPRPRRESTSSRSDSISQLQRLQQHNRVPCLGGKVCTRGHIGVQYI